MSAYVQRVLAATTRNNPGEKEFLQSVGEVFASLSPIIDQHPEYEALALLERLAEPERTIIFRVAWTDDQGQAHVNRGYRVQFNSALGPFKGGLRFHPSVDLSTMKGLAFEQTFKNSLTGLPIGGAKGGSDFNPKGRSDQEIMRFCQAFMTELYRHIGPDVDVPAGDIGVGAKELGYLFGQYKRIRNAYENGVLTGKDPLYGGSKVRPEATGFGAAYYVNEVFRNKQDHFEGKLFALSGFGNVCWGAVKKITQLGGKVVTISGPDGYIYDPEGVSTDEKIDFLVHMRNSRRDRAEDYADQFGAQFFPGEKPWGREVDVVMPCAIQNEVSLEDAKKIVKAGVKYYIEVSNIPSTPEALSYLMGHPQVTVAPSKAVNAGGVSVSALEMSQNAMRYAWEAQEVDEKLQSIMKNIHDASMNAAQAYGFGYDLVAGANIAAFQRLANTMLALGTV